MTSSFPPDTRFKFPWRPYQQRVLDELEVHLEDDHLHVVAAPGSGKTVLGLEVVRHLNQPTLVLAPTRAIRDQWIDRFRTLFLPAHDECPDWISRDIRSPGFLTVSTYQGIHMACTGERTDEATPEEEPTDDGERPAGRPVMPASLREVRTLVVDEAHHLRSEWWKSLMVIKQSLPGVRIVSLTATPPYDVDPAEWNRYQELCGEVDAEVPVPELVQEGNLCPHQDCVMMSVPAAREREQIRRFRQDVEAFLADFCDNLGVIKVVESHPWLVRPQQYLEAILADPSYASAMLIFLHHVRGEAPGALRRLLGVSRGVIPAFDATWAEVLLRFLLYGEDEYAEAHADVMLPIRDELHAIGAVERRQIQLRSTREIRKLMTTSISKLDSILGIVRLEVDELGDGLRLVVLTDYIRRSMLPRFADELKPLTRIGVVPIFEKLRRELESPIPLGVLTGSLVILPAYAYGRLTNLVADAGVPGHLLRATPLPHDPEYFRVDASGAAQAQMVSWVTALYAEGAIRVLIGTASLLGEGWDAPCTNSLVLASFVGSYMLSCQMRGRAIRTQRGHPDKTANIWHPVCVEPGGWNGGNDYETLERRMKAFIGVSHLEPVLENGVARLGLGAPPYSEGDVRTANESSERWARDRDGMRGRWDEALVGRIGQTREEIRTPSGRLPRAFVKAHALRALLVQGLTTGVASYAGMQVLAASESAASGSTVAVGAVGVLAAIFALVALPSTAKALWLFARHGPIAGSLKQIGKAVLHALLELGDLEEEAHAYRLRASSDGAGTAGCALDGGTPRERRLFLNAMQEVLAPIQNPRYLLVRHSEFGFFRRSDVHAVPQCAGTKKDRAEVFLHHWKKHVGPAELVYTRSEAGRKTLLSARGQSLSAAFATQAQRLTRWA